jgi:hypothetical protein
MEDAEIAAIKIAREEGDGGAASDLMARSSIRNRSPFGAKSHNRF